jgi:hypothetical protein
MKHKLGDQIQIAKGGFVSTSFDIKTSGKFAGECCLYQIYLPSGIRGLYFNIVEDEFILNAPGPTLQVFKFPGESVPVKIEEYWVYRVFCVDCHDIYGIKQRFRTDMKCYVDSGCYQIIQQ